MSQESHVLLKHSADLEKHNSASILENVFHRHDGVRVIALVRAKSSSEALLRVKTACTAYGTWSDSWESRLKCIPADLSKEKLGLSPDVWYMLENVVDVIINNGARVHWSVFPQRIVPLLKPIESSETLSRTSRAPPASIMLT